MSNTVLNRTYKLLKSTLDSIHNLNEDETEATLAVYSEDLRDRWSDYSNAFQNLERSYVAVNHGDLGAITNEYLKMHSLYLRAKMQLRDSFNLHELVNKPPSASNENNDGEIRSSINLPPIQIS